MERKLEEYRARKKAQTEQKKPADREVQPEITVTDHNNDSSTVSSVNFTSELKPTVCSQNTHTQVRSSAAVLPVGAHRHVIHMCSSQAGGETSGHWLLTHLIVLKVLLWLVLLGLFSELEFGLPFFLLSLFYWLYEGFRSPKPRQPGEMSAYSVFNPDCQPILGTLTAEQLEGEMGYRPMARR